jgi:hypothetical protein
MGVKTLRMGSNYTTSTTVINSGSGGINLNADINQPTTINSSGSTGAVTIGSSAVQTIGIGNDVSGAKTIGIRNSALVTTENIKGPWRSLWLCHF